MYLLLASVASYLGLFFISFFSTLHLGPFHSLHLLDAPIHSVYLNSVSPPNGLGHFSIANSQPLLYPGSLDFVVRGFDSLVKELSRLPPALGSASTAEILPTGLAYSFDRFSFGPVASRSSRGFRYGNLTSIYLASQDWAFFPPSLPSLSNLLSDFSTLAIGQEPEEDDDDDDEISTSEVINPPLMQFWNETQQENFRQIFLQVVFVPVPAYQAASPVEHPITFRPNPVAFQTRDALHLLEQIGFFIVVLACLKSSSTGALQSVLSKAVRCIRNDFKSSRGIFYRVLAQVTGRPDPPKDFTLSISSASAPYTDPTQVVDDFDVVKALASFHLAANPSGPPSLAPYLSDRKTPSLFTSRLLEEIPKKQVAFEDAPSTSATFEAVGPSNVTGDAAPSVSNDETGDGWWIVCYRRGRRADFPCRPLRPVFPDTEPSPPSSQRASISPSSCEYSTATLLQVISAAAEDRSPASEDRSKLQSENLVPPRLRGRPSPMSYSDALLWNVVREPADHVPLPEGSESSSWPLLEENGAVADLDGKRSEQPAFSKVDFRGANAYRQSAGCGLMMVTKNELDDGSGRIKIPWQTFGADFMGDRAFEARSEPTEETTSTSTATIQSAPVSLPRGRLSVKIPFRPDFHLTRRIQALGPLLSHRGDREPKGVVTESIPSAECPSHNDRPTTSINLPICDNRQPVATDLDSTALSSFSEASLESIILVQTRIITALLELAPAGPVAPKAGPYDGA